MPGIVCLRAYIRYNAHYADLQLCAVKILPKMGRI